jgi:hypothetical protein
MGALGYLLSLLTDVGPAGLLAGSAVGVLLLVVAARVLLGGRPAAARPLVTRGALRDRARRVGVPRHRDPDASGRTRPRAPTTALAAA